MSDLHAKIAEANKALYDKDSSILEDFNYSYSMPFLKRYMTDTLGECMALIDEKDRNKINMLDVGTGTGHLLTFAKGFVPLKNITAIDISMKNIERAKAAFPDASFILGDFLNSGTISGKFKFITAYSVLHHFYSAEDFINKIDEHLDKGGVFYIDHEPLGGLLPMTYNLAARIFKHVDKDVALAEYHQFKEPIDPAELIGNLGNYEIRITYQNVSLLGELYRKFKLDLSRFVPAPLLEYAGRKKLFKHFYLSYRIIGKKNRD